jgi:penicillin G amidase
MSAWDGSEHLGSEQATLFEGYWEEGLNTAVRDALIPAERRPLVPEVDWLVVRDVLASPGEWLGDDATAKRDAILLDSLTAAYEAASEALGADTSEWGYTGNSREMLHPLGDRDPSLNVGPFAIPGSSTTPIASGNASYKEVIDVGDWDSSVVMNNPGQSGVPGSDHYRDLAPAWAEGEHFPMLFSRGAIERNTESRILLVPARS